MHMPSVQPECADVVETMSRGDGLSAAEADHVRRCPVCSGRSGPVTRKPEGDLFAAVQSAVQKDEGAISGKLRSLPSWARFLVAGGWAALIVVTTTLATPRSGFGKLPLWRVTASVATLSALIVFAAFLGLRPLQLRAPKRAAVAWCFVLGLLAPFALALAPNAPTPALAARIGAVTGITFCFGLGTCAGLALMAGLFLLDRGGHRSRTAGLLAAVAGGLLGNVALELHCAITSHLHLLLGHAAIGVALVIGYLLVRRVEFSH